MFQESTCKDVQDERPSLEKPVCFLNNFVNHMSFPSGLMFILENINAINRM
jgi:hypothetical protein